MNDWIHCNSCFFRPTIQPTRKFHMMSCGHIYCGSCIEKGPKDKCRVCCQKCSSIEINRQMSVDTQLLFIDVAETAKKQHRQFCQILEFQKNHRNRLVSHYESQLKKAGQIFAQLQTDSKRKQELEQEIAAIKKQYKELVMKLYQSSSSRRSQDGVGCRYGSPTTPAQQGLSTPCMRRISFKDDHMGHMSGGKDKISPMNISTTPQLLGFAGPPKTPTMSDSASSLTTNPYLSSWKPSPIHATPSTTSTISPTADSRRRRTVSPSRGRTVSPSRGSLGEALRRGCTSPSRGITDSTQMKIRKTRGPETALPFSLNQNTLPR